MCWVCLVGVVEKTYMKSSTVADMLDVFGKINCYRIIIVAGNHDVAGLYNEYENALRILAENFERVELVTEVSDECVADVVDTVSSVANSDYKPVQAIFLPYRNKELFHKTHEKVIELLKGLEVGKQRYIFSHIPVNLEVLPDNLDITAIPQTIRRDLMYIMGHFHINKVFTTKWENSFQDQLKMLAYESAEQKGDIPGICVGSVFPTKSNDFHAGLNEGRFLVMRVKRDGTFEIEVEKMKGCVYEELQYGTKIQCTSDEEVFVNLKDVPKEVRVEALGKIKMEDVAGKERDVVVVAYETDMYKYIENKEVTDDVLSMTLKQKLDMFLKEENITGNVVDILNQFVVGDVKNTPPLI